MATKAQKIAVELELKENFLDQQLVGLETRLNQLAEKMRKKQEQIARAPDNKKGFLKAQYNVMQKAREGLVERVADAREERAWARSGDFAKWGKVFGVAAGTTLKEFAKDIGSRMAGEVSWGLDMYRDSTYNPMGGNRQTQREIGAVQGGLEGAMSGAQFGVFGAVIGGAVGAVKSLVMEQVQYNKSFREDVARSYKQRISMDDSMERSIKNRAFEKRYESVGQSKYLRQQMINKRLNELQYGEGDWSEKSIKLRLNQLYKQGRATSDDAEYQQMQERLTTVRNEIQSFTERGIDLQMERRLTGTAKGGEILAASSRSGLMVGGDANIDFKALRKPELDELKRIAKFAESLDKKADKGTTRQEYERIAKGGRIYNNPFDDDGARIGR